MVLPAVQVRAGRAPDTEGAQRSPRRLIEVSLPFTALGRMARREKSLRHGHPSTLHTWWARKPLGVCRAEVLAALWPDPADADCPAGFRAELADALGVPIEDGLGLRRAACAFLEGFAPWEASADPERIAVARRLVAAADRSLGGDGAPLVVDPFAGGGSIGLESLRVGARAMAGDLNPVAALLCRALLEEIPAAGTGLAAAVRAEGAAVAQRAWERLQACYPAAGPGDRPLAYLWARTAACAGCQRVVPLMSKMALEDTPRRRIGLRLDGQGAELVPLAEAWPPNGTVQRAAMRCPFCGTVTPAAEVRRQLSARGGGTADARLLAVLTAGPEGRAYRLPDAVDFAGIRAAEAALAVLLAEDPEAVPREPLPPQGTIGFSLRPYGLRTWGDLFTPRQALAIATLARLVRGTEGRLLAAGAPAAVARATATCLALAVDRQADYGSSLCRWHTTRALVNNTFGRQALPLVWDFAESNPWGGGSGAFSGAVEWVARVCSAVAAAHLSPGHVYKGSAARIPLADGTARAVVTDPPYFDAVPYADIAEFFHVWLRRSASTLHADLLADAAVPRAEEAVASGAGGKDGEHFERVMGAAMAEMRRVLDPRGVAVVIFAQRRLAGWQAQARAMLAAGWQITASWAVATEMGARLRARNSAVLSSTVHLVCRPQPEGSPVGDGETVRARIRDLVTQRLPLWGEAGLAGLDAAFAACGAALEAYSAYARVEGLRIEEALGLGTGLCAAAAADRLLEGSADPEARLAVRWARLHGGARLPTAVARDLAHACGADLDALTEAGGPFAAEGDLIRWAGAMERGPGLAWQAGSALDRLHLAMWQLSSGGSAVLDQTLKGLLPNDPLWALGQALLGLGVVEPAEQRLLEAVLGRYGLAAGQAG